MRETAVGDGGAELFDGGGVAEEVVEGCWWRQSVSFLGGPPLC